MAGISFDDLVPSVKKSGAVTFDDLQQYGLASDLSPEQKRNMNPADVIVPSAGGGARAAAYGFSAGQIPFANRITSAMSAGAIAPFVDETYSQLYRQAMADTRATQEANPGMTTLGNVAGAVSTLPAAFSSMPGKAGATSVMGVLNPVRNATTIPAAKGLKYVTDATGKLVSASPFKGSGVAAGAGNLAAKMVGGAAVAAPVTGAYFAGEAQPGEMGEQFVEGAKLGGALGVALPVAGAALGAVIHPFKTVSGAVSLLNDITDKVAGGISRKLNVAGLSDDIVKDASGKVRPNADILFLKTLQDEGISVQDALESLKLAKQYGATPSVAVTAGVPQMQTQGQLMARGSAGTNVARKAVQDITENQIPLLNRRLVETATGGGMEGAENYGKTVVSKANEALKSKADVLRNRAAPFYEKAFSAPAVINDDIARIVDQPEMRAGIARGLKIQRIEAAAQGKKFDPMSYGITAFDEAGDPIISGVPNMRLLDAGKRGLDAMIEENKNQFGKPNEMARALVQLKTSLLNRLDDINPNYKTARRIYSEDAGAFKSLIEGPLGKMAQMADGDLSKVADDLMKRDPQYIRKFVSGTDEKMRRSVAGAYLSRKLEESGGDALKFSQNVFKSEGSSNRLKALVGEEVFEKMKKIDAVTDALLQTKNIPGGSITSSSQALRGDVADIPTSLTSWLAAMKNKIAPDLLELVRKDPAQAKRFNELLLTDEGFKLLESVSNGAKITGRDIDKIGLFINKSFETTKDKVQ